MSNVVTQPVGAAPDKYLLTLSSDYDLVDAVSRAGTTVDLTDFLVAHPSGRARIWSVGVSRPAVRAWAKMSVGDLVLFYTKGAVRAYGTIDSKIYWPQNSHIWPTGSDWDHVYSLSEFVELPEGQWLEYQSLRSLSNKLDVQSVGCRDQSEFGVTRDELIEYVVRGGPRHGGAVRRDGIPDEITAEDVRVALEELKTSGVPSGFGERTDWVVDHEGRWYVPKAVIGVAAKRVLGRVLKASEFSGGQGAGQANSVLRNLGFDVLRRNGEGVQKDPIKEWVDGLRSTRRAPTVDGALAPHQPATILWLLSEFIQGKPRLQGWSTISQTLSALIVDAGGGAAPEYPLAVLAKEKLIDVQGLNFPLPSTSSDLRRIFNEINPSFGLTEELYLELGAQPDRITEVLDSVGEMFSRASSFKAVKQKLNLDRTAPNPTPVVPLGQKTPGRKAVTASSIQRSAEVSKWVKQTYEDTCQVCRTRLQIPGKATSDAAHIRGLGTPHDGPDVIENVLCLCPNHHRTFDGGAWTLTVDFKVKDLLTGAESGSLNLHETHPLNQACIRYHRDYWSSNRGT